MENDEADDPLAGAEALVLNLVLARIALRARLSVETDLRALEDQVGELAPVRAQIERLFDVSALPAAKVRPSGELPPRAAQLVTTKRGVGRPRKSDRDDAAGPETADA